MTKQINPQDNKLISSPLLDVPSIALEDLARQQGVGPVDFDQLLAKGDFWPEEESVDDFIAAVREWRKDDQSRERELD